MAEWEIGENFGLTRERVRQMRQIALSKLRESENAIRLLSKYL
jgi:RNA polymerase primary sigma factor